MGWCPFCNLPFDEDNETQPCCPGCGYPLDSDLGDFSYEDYDNEPDIDINFDYLFNNTDDPDKTDI